MDSIDARRASKLLVKTYTNQGTNLKRSTTLPTVSTTPSFTYRKGDKGTNLWLESIPTFPDSSWFPSRLNKDHMSYKSPV